jgi:PAS domain S-box-containing protein
MTAGGRSLVVVAPDAERRRQLADALAHTDDDVDRTDPEALSAVGGPATYDCVVVAGADPDDVARTVAAVQRRAPETPCLVTASDGDEATAAAATRAGATEYVPRAGTGVEYLHERIAAVVERDRTRETALRGLNRAAREMTLAESERRVCEHAVSTATEVLDLPMTSVYLHDESDDVLRSAAASDAVRELFGSPPDLLPGESLAWETFQAGEPAVVDDLTEDDRTQNPQTPIRSELQVPLGEYGVLLTGSTARGAFDEFDVELCRSLGATTEAALRRTERERSLREYRTVFDTLQDRVYVLDEDSCFRLLTDPLCDLLGCERQELLGEHISTVVAEEGRSDRVRTALERLAVDDDPEPLTVETEVYDADGGTVPVEADIVPFPSDDHGFAGSVGVVRDVSERRRVKRELAVERNRLSRLLESLPDAVVYAQFDDGDPIVQSVNERFEETFGYDEQQLVGESLNDYIIPPELEDEARRIDDAAENGEYPQVEVRRRTADGIRYFLFRGVPIDGPGDGTEGFGIYTDITEQKTRQRRLRVLNRVLRHNLRNEMNVIVGNADIVAEAVEDCDALGTDADVRSRVREITDTATDVAEIGERVRQLERALDRSGVGSVDATALVADVGERYRGHPTATVEIALPDSLPVRGGDLLSVAVDDLVENAVEHGDPPTTVTVSGQRAGEWVELSVADDGPGIPAEEIAALSDDADTSQLSHGSGLGLWLVDWLATSLGGEVTFGDNDPRGSVVTLRLPAAEAE